MSYKQRCYVCLRFISCTNRGQGVFRRHMISKGEICKGSWKFPDTTKKIGPTQRVPDGLQPGQMFNPYDLNEVAQIEKLIKRRR